ncbi:FtsH protease activity modulator HflK [Methyloraptor flagellatus]|jgi:membrane protease subunit HflK|uniref:Protein HflK n=1 Tax=Methyloraptor flagellatus TaxID=3162530 RepID=A0AAU7XEI5_9HYPH
MPWSNQSGGGGWKGGGGGGPWGSPPRGPNGGGSPDLDEILRRGQDKLKTILPGGSGFGGRGLAIALVAGAALWLATGFYRVEPDELGVELVFGKVIGQTKPGLNYNFPYPVGQVQTVQVLSVRELTIGSRDVGRSGGLIQTRLAPEESQMLTGDENLVDVDFKVQWNVKDATAFLFNIQDPERTVRAVAESAMREVVGRNNIQPILTEDRQKIEQSVRELMQKALDSYNAGVDIRLVQMQKVDPPSVVIDAFRDVQAARADAERMQNEALAFAGQVVPGARGQAAQITAEAQAYRQRIVEEARGQADRFTKVYEEYKRAPEVTRERLYLETMERVLGGMDKVIVEQKEGAGVVPYLPLDSVRRQQSRATQQQGAQ